HHTERNRTCNCVRKTIAEGHPRICNRKNWHHDECYQRMHLMLQFLKRSHGTLSASLHIIQNMQLVRRESWNIVVGIRFSELIKIIRHLPDESRFADLNSCRNRERSEDRCDSRMHSREKEEQPHACDTDEAIEPVAPHSNEISYNEYVQCANTNAKVHEGDF